MNLSKIKIIGIIMLIFGALLLLGTAGSITGFVTFKETTNEASSAFGAFFLIVGMILVAIGFSEI